ncbi:hypothetical protein [Chromohalobacter canadensis]|uniref:hypothetical protein n=1 Tax=Chromohalobacter canadensis TaxID=141389 RepID=UPI00240F45EC|nr:hypothetical protein [Chromohalobacter canadensis]
MAAFDTQDYLVNKAAQLNKTGQDGKNNWTVADVKKAFNKSGLSAQEHYDQYGKKEGIATTSKTSSPSMVTPVFDADAYLKNKTEQLNVTNYQGRTDWTSGQTAQAFSDAGLTAQEHYDRYGADEGILPYAEAQPVSVSSSAPQSTVSPNQTSQYQLEQMLASDSPLMQRAATQGQQQANQRGLLNSSMAAEASQGAMIDRATPLAQQDAQTYFQNSQANTDRQQQAFMSNLQYQQNLGLNEQQFGFDTQKLAQQYGYDSALSEQSANQALDNLYATSTANAWGVYANNVTDLVGQSASAINQIQMNPDITEDNKASMIEQILEMRDTDLEFQQDLYGSLSSYMTNTGVFPSIA